MKVFVVLLTFYHYCTNTRLSYKDTTVEGVFMQRCNAENFIERQERLVYGEYEIQEEYIKE